MRPSQMSILLLLTIFAILMTQGECRRRKSEFSKCVSCLKENKYFHTKLMESVQKCHEKTSSLSSTLTLAGTNDTGVIMTEAGCQNLTNPAMNRTSHPSSSKPGLLSCPTSCPPSKPCPKSVNCPPPILLTNPKCPAGCPEPSSVPSKCPVCTLAASNDDDDDEVNSISPTTTTDMSTQHDMIFRRNSSTTADCISSLQTNWTMAALISTLVLLSGLLVCQFIVIIVMILFPHRFRRPCQIETNVQCNQSQNCDFDLEESGPQQQPPKNVVIPRDWPNYSGAEDGQRSYPSYNNERSKKN